MPFSHHSHSGQFCGHAANTLEEVIQTAISKKVSTFCLTEHIPREEIDFYPEEANVHTQATLTRLFDDYYHEARRLQKAYADQTQILVGFEGEWIRESSLGIIQDILEKYPVDLFVGSVHHVHTIPIDFDTPMYHKAREIAGGSDEKIFADYFDSQYEMLKALKPPLVGHFDLIRLKSDEPDRSFRTWPAVWEKIERNLKFIAEYGGVLELNTSSLRKGMSEAYPQSEICKVSGERPLMISGR
jgi:histidinol-phosphatase (PHP family)